LRLLGSGGLLCLGADSSNVDLSNRLIRTLYRSRSIILILLSLGTKGSNIDLANGLVAAFDHIAGCIVSLDRGTSAGSCGRLLAEIGNVDLCGLVSGLDLLNLRPCDRRSISTPAVLIHILILLGSSSDDRVGSAGCGRGEDGLCLDGRRCAGTRGVRASGRVLGARSVGHLLHDRVNFEISFGASGNLNMVSMEDL
jgi:hypothetical protein